MVDEYSTRSILTRIAMIEATQRDVADTLSAKRQRDRAVAAPFVNPVLLGGAGAAPTNGIAGGAVTENRLWAYNYESTALGKQTTLSATSTANLIAEQNTLTGPRSTDPQVDKVNIFTSLVGSTGEDWYRVAQVANPASGTWSTVDNSALSAYLGNPQPLAFQVPVSLTCGEGFRFRRAKMRLTGDLASDASAYWMFWLSIIADQNTRAYWQTPTQRSNTVGFLKDSLYPVPLMGGATISEPESDFNLPINENDLIVFCGRAVGAVAPLPSGTIIATVSEPEV